MKKKVFSSVQDDLTPRPDQAALEWINENDVEVVSISQSAVADVRGISSNLGGGFSVTVWYKEK